MTDITLKINGIQSQVTLTDDGFDYTQEEVKSRIEYADIIGFDNPPSKEEKETTQRKVFYINPTQKENVLEKKVLHLSGNNNAIAQLCSSLKEKIERVEGRPKSVVVFLNPIGGSANARDIYRKDVEPILKIAEIKTELVVSEKADHFKELGMSYDFCPYDALVILGGDGTANELINALIHRKQKECGIDVQDPKAVYKPVDIPIVVLPTGTGNGLAKVVHGCIDVVTSTLHIIKGRTKNYPVFSNFCDNRLVAFSVLLTAYGMFADLIHSMDSKRWLKKLRYVFVPAWFFLWRTIRPYDAEVTMETQELVNEIEDTTQPTSPDAESRLSTKNEMMSLTNVFALPFSSGVFIEDDPYDSIKCSDEFRVLLYKPTTRFGVLKSFFSMMGKITKKDFENTGFITVHTVKSCQITIPHSESDLDLNINLDGEIYRLTKPEIDIRLIQNVYRMYSSYERNPTTPE